MEEGPCPQILPITLIVRETWTPASDASHRAQGILFLDEATARFVGRKANGDRVDVTFPASDARVSQQPSWLERFGPLGRRLAIYDLLPVCIATASGEKYFFRAQRLFGIQFSSVSIDSAQRTKEIYEALKQRLPEAAK